MPLVPEDGTGLANANSYVTATTYRQFYVDRKDTVITGAAPTDVELEADLYEAFTFVNRRRRYRGTYLNSAQAGAFPRAALYDREGRLVSGVPAQVKEAQMRAARAHRDKSLTKVEERKGALQSKSVGPISESRYAPPAAPGRDFSLIDNLLDEFSVAGGISGRIAR